MKKTTILKFVATLLCLALCASSVMALSNGLFAAKKVAASDLDDVKQEKEDKEQQRKDVQKKMDEYKASAQDTKEYMEQNWQKSDEQNFLLFFRTFVLWTVYR